MLRLLEIDSDLSQRELAQALGISLGKANYCVRSLLDSGLIKMHNFRRSGNKLGYAYLLTSTGVTAKADLTVRFLKAKIREYEMLKEEIAELQCGAQGLDGGWMHQSKSCCSTAVTN